MSYTKIILISFFFICLAGNVNAQSTAFPWAQQLSATQIITTQNTTLTSKVNVDAGRVRAEATLNGMNMITIILPEKKLVYSVLPQQKMVMEIPMDLSDQQHPTAMDLASLKHELLGEELRGGVLCNKYKLSTANSKPQIFWVKEHASASGNECRRRLSECAMERCGAWPTTRLTLCHSTRLLKNERAKEAITS